MTSSPSQHRTGPHSPPEHGGRPTVTGAALVTSVLAPLGYAAGVLLAGRAISDPWSRSLSDLAASGSPGHGTMTVMMVGVALCLIVTSRGLHTVDGMARFLVGGAGVALLFVAWLPADAIGDANVSQLIAGAVCLAGLILSPAISARPDLVRVPPVLHRKVGATVTLLFVALTGLLVLLLVSRWSVLGLSFGGWERIVFFLALAWPAVEALGSRRP